MRMRPNRFALMLENCARYKANPTSCKVGFATCSIKYPDYTTWGTSESLVHILAVGPMLDELRMGVGRAIVVTVLARDLGALVGVHAEVTEQ